MVGRWWKFAGVGASIGLVAGGICLSGGVADGASTAAVANAKKIVAAHEHDVKFPTLPAGPTPASGKKIFIVSSSQSLTGDIRVVNAIEQAAKILGWTYTLVDGKTSPTAQNAGFEEAATQHAYAVFDVYVNTASTGSGVAQLHAENIPIIGILSGSPTTGTDSVTVTDGSTAFNHEMGTLDSYYAIAASGGTAHVLQLWTTSFSLDPPIGKGQVTTLKACKGCSVDVVHWAVTELVTGLPGLVQTALTQHPTIDYVETEWDASVSFIDQGIRNASSSAEVISTGGNKANLTLIRTASGETAVAAEPLEYIGFLAVNDLVRLEGKKSQVKFTAPLKVLVASNLPAKGAAWTGDTNFVPSFKKLWHR